MERRPWSADILSAVRAHLARGLHEEAGTDAGEPQAGCLRSHDALPAPLSAIRSRQLTLSNDVADHRLQQICFRCAGLQRQLRVEHINCEDVTMCA